MGENANANANANDEVAWESASNDRVFREQAAQETQEQPTGEPSTPAVTTVRWDIDEDNSNNNNNNNVNDVSFLTSETNGAGAPPPNTSDGRNSSNRNISNRNSRGCRKSCSNCLSRCSLNHFLHVWDIVLTTLWIVFIGYHLYYNKDNEPSRSTSMAILLVTCTALAILNALRGFLWVWASLPSLSTICCCGCCFCEDDTNTNTDNNNNNNNRGVATGVSKLATNLTLSLGIVYGVVSVVAWLGPSSWLPWCDGLGSWCSELIPTQTTVMPIALTAASAIELLRWVFFQGQLSSSSSSSSSSETRSPDYYNDEVDASSTSESSRHRPWWFNRHSNNSNNNGNDGLRDPLLESSATTTTTNGQPSWAMTSWIPFSSPRRSSSRNSNSNSNNATNNTIINGDEEDVGSVLDSLGEDWASRAESDPYWWTR